MPSSYVGIIGRTLRQARVQKDVTLLEAQMATKIRQSFLQALEEENYAVLPPPVYIRGFLKNYAAFLGLEGAEIVQSFDELLEAVAMGLEPYHAADSGSADSGSADSGGLHLLTEPSIPITAQTPVETNNQTLKDTVEILAVTAEESEFEIALAEVVEEKRESKPEVVITESNKVAVETEVEKVGTVEVTVVEPQPIVIPEVTFSKPIASQALLSVRPKHTTSMLRQPGRYVLKPAMAPLNKPAFYIPNFMPLLAVLIIFAAATLLLLRGVAVPPTNDRLAATATHNVYSAPTVTPIAGTPVAVSNTQMVKPTAIAVTTTIVPNPTVVARIVLGSAAPTTTEAATIAVTAPTKPPVKLEVVVDNDGSWVQVWVDDKSTMNELVKGKTISFEGKDKIEIVLGRPVSVKLLVNGQEKQYAPANSGTVVKAFKSDGSEEIVNR
ncbi:RodZ domain-containing protein [Candidatus Chlorohelix sp.]|uniref:helix-turn-helix domain-containing protein n=1 Tax=Candidatus Chlorohelix sp. TaxID=3139201 RepID=UPI00305082F8